MDVNGIRNFLSIDRVASARIAKEAKLATNEKLQKDVQHNKTSTGHSKCVVKRIVNHAID